MFWMRRLTKPAQAPKKTKKNKETKETKVQPSPNLHRHQKKQKKKQEFQIYAHASWLLAGVLFFLFFFGACAGLVHLVVWFFWFFWCLCRLGEFDFTKHWKAPKNQRNQSATITKPAQAPKQPKKTKIPNLCLCFLTSCCFFFFWCLCRFGELSWLKAPKTTMNSHKTIRNPPSKLEGIRPLEPFSRNSRKKQQYKQHIKRKENKKAKTYHRNRWVISFESILHAQRRNNKQAQLYYEYSLVVRFLTWIE